MTSCPLYRAEDIAWPRASAFMQQVPTTLLPNYVTMITTDSVFSDLRTYAQLPDELVTTVFEEQGVGAYAEPKLQNIVFKGPRQPITLGLLIHELAHLCTPADAYHDHRFCANYLRLVGRWCGEIAARELRVAMRQTGAFTS